MEKKKKDAEALQSEYLLAKKKRFDHDPNSAVQIYITLWRKQQILVYRHKDIITNCWGLN
jgi:hypothetical protein